MSNSYQNDPINELRKSSNKPKRGLSLLSIALLLAVLGTTITGASYLYFSAKDKPEGEVAIINIDNEEIKIKPEDPGGMVVDNMDRVIYDTIDGYKENDKEQVKILPPSEEPVDKQAFMEQPKTEAIEEIAVEEMVVVDGNPKEPSSSGEATGEATKSEFIKPKVTAETSNKLVDLKKRSEKRFMVQLASFRAKSDAEKEWSNLSRRYAKILSKYQYTITSKNIEGKGLFYRLQVGPFGNEAEAIKICKSFKESRINCITVKD